MRPGAGVAGASARTTRQRAAVTARLAEHHEFLSAQELHADLSAHGNRIGLATVYRCLALMVQAGEVDVLMRDDGAAVYLLCSGPHHHHLVCRSCGRTVTISGPDIEQWARTEAERHGYTDASHALEVFGTCPRHGPPMRRGPSRPQDPEATE